MAFTFFFRDLQALNIITDLIVKKLSGKKYVDIWDAGCAMGPEPYSLALVLRESMSKFRFRNVRIFATDIDPQDEFGRIIRNGVYPFDQIKRIPHSFLDQYFSPFEKKDGYFKIREDIHKSITFQKHDLLTFKPIREGLGIIVCKNVLLHFNQEQRIKAFKMFHHALIDDGFLVVENTQKIPKTIAHLFDQVVPSAQIFRKMKGHV